MSDFSTPVPEPASIILLISGCVAMLLKLKRG
ncbi:MAG: PEP-CTERM sorting domain-containing protein [Candidatus Auribacterota bacterium]